MKHAVRDPLLRLVESYINDHLRRVRGASPHTVRAYAHALRLFFVFLARHTGRPVAKLRLDDMRDYALLVFLYNTGARISEALAVTPADLHLAAPRHVRLQGKGRRNASAHSGRKQPKYSPAS